MNPPPLVMPSTRGRDLVIVVCAVLASLAFGAFVLLTLGAGVVGNTLTGTIVKKEFIPHPEQQVTIGRDGVLARRIEGDYVMEVCVGQQMYNIWVDKRDYEAKKPGEKFTFIRPK